MDKAMLNVNPFDQMLETSEHDIDNSNKRSYFSDVDGCAEGLKHCS